MQKMEFYGFQRKNKGCIPLALTAHCFQAILLIMYGPFSIFFFLLLAPKTHFQVHTIICFYALPLFKSNL